MLDCTSRIEHQPPVKLRVPGAAVAVRRTAIRVGSICLLLLVAACTTFRPQPLDIERGLAAFETRRLDDPDLRHYMEQSLDQPITPWPPQSWDSTQLTLVADYYRADLAIARAKRQAAESALISAGARPNPSFDFSPSYDTTAEPGISPWTLGFTLDIPIETAGKRGYRIAEAEHLANAARLELASIAWQVRSRVRIGLVQLQADERAEDILARQLSAEREAVQLLEARLNVGQASTTEVQLVRIAAGQTALRLQEAQKQTGQARGALAAALGLPETALTGIRVSFNGLEALPPVDQVVPARREALLNRTDVLSALANYEATESALQLEIAKQYPDVRVGPGFSHGYTASELENAISFGISLSLPILNRNQGPIREAEAHRQEAAANFNAVQARAVAEVDQAIAGYRSSLAKLKAAQQLLDQQRRRADSVQALFDAGEADRLMWVQGQSELAISELARAQAFTEAQLALGQIEDAMQRSTDFKRMGGSSVREPAEQTIGKRP